MQCEDTEDPNKEHKKEVKESLVRWLFNDAP
jgi:hypothetical protein